MYPFFTNMKLMLTFFCCYDKLYQSEWNEQFYPLASFFSSACCLFIQNTLSFQGGYRMANYIIDLILFAVVLIGISAFMGPIGTGIGYLFSGKRKMYQVHQSEATQVGWKPVGGKQQ